MTPCACMHTCLQVIKLVAKYKLDMPSVTVEYSGLTVETDALVGSAAIATVGSSFINLFKGMVGIRPQTQNHQILKDIKGILVPVGVASLASGCRFSFLQARLCCSAGQANAAAGATVVRQEHVP